MRVIVVGGGAAGLMASFSAARNGAEVILLEKNKVLGKKLLLTGGKRCNLTNNKNIDEIIEHIYGNGKFLYSALNQFDNKDIINFFEERGVKLKEEDHGRIFPKSDSAETVLNVFIDELKKYNVKVCTSSGVRKILIENSTVKGVELKSGESILGDAVILSTGGKSFPQTGSTGDGYDMAKFAGHNIVKLFPTEVPLLSSEPFIKKKELMGLSFRNVALSVIGERGKYIVTQNMDIIFTHFGISGPAALRCSGFVYMEQCKRHESNIMMNLDIFPKLSNYDLEKIFRRWREKDGKKSVKNHLKTIVPERFAEFILKKVNISSQKSIAEVSDLEINEIIDLMKNFRFSVNGTLPIEKSFVTGGGVCVNEINPKTMESKFINNLYICGELLDIYGYTGGYNITAAFVTGYVAGKSSAERNYRLE